MTEAEAEGLFMRQIKARDLYAKMMRTMAQTGNGWMTFKDAANRKSNQTGQARKRRSPFESLHRDHRGHIERRNGCLQSRFDQRGAVCEREGEFDFEKLRSNVRLAVRQLDRVIDLNYYAIPSTADSNNRWRNIGLGVMGLQDVFFQLRLPFDSDEARKISAKIQEEIYFAALDASCDLAMRKVLHPAFHETRAADGDSAVRSLGRHARRLRTLGRPARKDQRARTAQFA